MDLNNAVAVYVSTNHTIPSKGGSGLKTITQVADGSAQLIISMASRKGLASLLVGRCHGPDVSEVEAVRDERRRAGRGW